MKLSIHPAGGLLLVKALCDYLEHTDRVMADIAREMEESAKADAPWRDRTGMARATLTGASGCSGVLGLKKYARICGMMSYSPSLELKHEGRYQVLLPTALKYESVLRQRLTGL